MVRVLVIFLTLAAPAPALAQNSLNGFLRFSGVLERVQEQDRQVHLEVSVYSSRMAVDVNEHTTVTASLGGRTSARSLVPGLFVEIEGWLLRDGRVRASEVEIKVQAGAMRLTGRVENLVPAQGYVSMIVAGAEFKLDDRSTVVANKNGLGATGAVTDLQLGNEVDVTGTYLDESGKGPATSGLFHADRVIMNKTFRIQGVIRSRAPAVGNPTVVVVHGIVVTVTPETTVASNGMNERNEAFMPRDTTPVVSPIEDDAGNPCLNVPGGAICPDIVPKDPAAAGELRLGAFVRIEGILEDTGFTTRYTARAVQVEKPQQVRFQAIVQSRDSKALTVRLNDNLQTQVLLDGATQLEGEIAAGRLVEITAAFNPDLSIVGRRVKALQ